MRNNAQARLDTARQNLARLEERRLAALDGVGRAPDPAVIAAAEEAVRKAEARLAKQRAAA